MAKKHKTEPEKIATQLVNAIILLSNVGPHDRYSACIIAVERLEKEWPSLANPMRAMANNLYCGER